MNQRDAPEALRAFAEQPPKSPRMPGQSLERRLGHVQTGWTTWPFMMDGAT